MSGSQPAWLYLVKWVSHWNTLPTTKTPQTGQATSSLQRPLDLSTSGRLFLLFLYISRMGPHLTPCNCSQQAIKIKHSTTKQSSFALPACSFMSFPATFENFHNYSLSQVEKKGNNKTTTTLSCYPKLTQSPPPLPFPSPLPATLCHHTTPTPYTQIINLYFCRDFSR